MNPEQLHAYLDGALSAEDAAAVERAVETDAAVAAELEALRAVDRALEVLPGADAEAGFTQRVLDRIAVPEPKGRVLRWIAPLAAAAAALALAVFWPEASAPARAPVAEAPPEYVWEADAETFGSLALEDLEDEILAELEAT